MAPATPIASSMDRLAEAEATLVPALMSWRRVVLSMRRGTTSARPRIPAEKSVTVLLSFAVEAEILLMAAMMVWSSAKTVATRTTRGRMLRRILRLVTGGIGNRFLAAELDCSQCEDLATVVPWEWLCAIY